MTKQGRSELVVVGVDGSPASEAALAWAARYAHAIGARLRAVLAWHYPSAAGGPPVGVAPASVTSQVEQSRYEILDKSIAATCGDEHGREIERKVVYGHPVQVLIEESKEADLLVVGHTGHDGFTGMLLGSVSTHTVTHASCPVTVVRTA
jgi:nucleotide-binding universal stress UspA family protein